MSINEPLLFNSQVDYGAQVWTLREAERDICGGGRGPEYGTTKSLTQIENSSALISQCSSSKTYEIILSFSSPLGSVRNVCFHDNMLTQIICIALTEWFDILHRKSNFVPFSPKTNIFTGKSGFRGAKRTPSSMIHSTARHSRDLCHFQRRDRRENWTGAELRHRRGTDQSRNLAPFNAGQGTISIGYTAEVLIEWLRTINTM